MPVRWTRPKRAENSKRTTASAPKAEKPQGEEPKGEKPKARGRKEAR